MSANALRAAAVFLVASAMLAAGSCARQTAPEPPAVEPPTGPAVGSGSAEGNQATGWQLSSSAFADAAEIPADYTCSGKDVSPPLAWTDPPEGTVQLALTCSDPDAPSGEWVHWIIYMIPPQTRELPQGVAVSAKVLEPSGAVQGVNDFRTTGYRGPCPPPGAPHHYAFRLYALGEALTLEPGATRAELLKAMEGKTLGQVELTGTYAR